jgi:uncharacterized protein involved in exopolysaccharide biosynthesis
MEQISRYLKVLRDGWWVIALCMLAAFSTSLLLAYLETPLYRTSARFLLTPTSNLEEYRDFLSAMNPLDDATLTATYAEILQSNYMFDKSVQAMGLMPDQTRGYEYRAVVLPQSNVLELFVSGPDPEIATYLATTMAYQTISYIAEVYPTFDLRILDSANVPTSSFTPNPKRDGMISAFLGAGAGVGILLAIAQLQIILASIRDEQEQQSTEDTSSIVSQPTQVSS